MKDELIVEEGVEGHRWERLMEAEARPKVQAALQLAESALKYYVPTVPEIPAMSGSGSSYRSTTKKEAVTLPKFAGAEKVGWSSPFLEFPIWLQNWNLHIEDYEEKSRANMLLSHLDKDALKRIAGSESDYKAVMKKLEDYYADKRKVIRD